MKPKPKCQIGTQALKKQKQMSFIKPTNKTKKQKIRTKYI